jgi:hypothetical protein
MTQYLNLQRVRHVLVQFANWNAGDVIYADEARR